LESTKKKENEILLTARDEEGWLILQKGMGFRRLKARVVLLVQGLLLQDFLANFVAIHCEL
jgi:hypothetical protein